MMKSINPHNIRGDISGGIIAGIVALPLALAFGVSSGAGAIAGLYGAITVGFFAALFGGTQTQISGPTGPMTVVMAAMITDFMAQYPESGLAMAFTVVMLGGLLQILFGVLKLGKYVSMMPYAVISGFMSGIGLIIILLEIPVLLGDNVRSGVIPALKSLPQALSSPHPIEIILGLTVVISIYIWPRRLKAIFPAPLFALIITSLFVAFLMPDAGIHVLGDIPSGLPTLHMPVFTAPLIFVMFKAALILALLGSIDSLLTSLVADNITASHHDPEKELIGQGIGNMAAGFLGGLPGAGATMRTVINVQNGGRSRLSGIIHALVLLSLVLGLGHYVSYIPHTVLAGILITVGIGIIDWSFIKRIRSFPHRITVVMVTVLLITVFVDLITAVAVGVIISSLSTVKRLADLQIKMTKEITAENAREHLPAKESALLEKRKGAVLLYQMQGPLSFGAAKHMLKTLCKESDYEVLILDLTYVPMVDVTTALTIEDIIKRVSANKKDIRFVGLREEILAQFQQLILTGTTLEERHYNTLAQALKAP